MTGNEIGQLIGGAIGSVIGVLFFLCLFVMILGWPLLAWSAVRSLRRIAASLERIADAPPAVATREPEIGRWSAVTAGARSGSSSAGPSR
jgi:hypothetical protein